MIHQVAGLLLDVVRGPRCAVCGTRCRRRHYDQHTYIDHPGEHPRRAA